MLKTLKSIALAAALVISGAVSAGAVRYIQDRPTGSLQPGPITMNISSGTIVELLSTTGTISNLTTDNLTVTDGSATLDSVVTSTLTASSSTITNQDVHGTQTFTATGSTGTPNISLGNGCVVYQDATESFIVACNDTELMRVDNDGVTVSTAINAQSDAALSTVTAAATADDLEARIGMLAEQIRVGFGLTNWYDTITRNGQSLQYVYDTIDASTETTATTFVDSGLECTMTLGDSGNLVRLSAGGMIHNNSTGQNTFYTITRNGTDLGKSGSEGFGRDTSPGGGPRHAWGLGGIMDAPGTTSVTYKLRFRVDGGIGGGLALTGRTYFLCEEIGQ